jgi:hypothetical protein
MSSIKLRCLDNSGNNIFVVDSDTGILGTNTSESLNSTTGCLVLSGGISINKTSNASSITAGGSLTIAGGASFAKDVHIGGNLTVYGTQTQIVSQVVRIQDNLLVVNAVPNTGRDGGILFQRYQLENNTGLGDIVQDTPSFTFTLTNATSTSITLDGSANSTDNFYVNSFIKITSGTGINQVRQITAYNGTTKVATVNTWNIIPSNGDTISIYNRVYASYFYSEATDNFVLGWTTDDTQSSSVNVSDYIGLKSGYISIQNTQNASGLGTGGSFTTLGGASVSKKLYVGEDSVFATNVTISNSVTTNTITSVNVNVTSNLTVGNTLTSLNTISTNSTISNGIITNLLTTSITSNNIISTGISSSSLNVTNSTLANVNCTSQTVTNQTVTNQTVTNQITTNSSTSSLVVSKLNALGNSNTLGSLFTTGGNVGIGIASPSYHLDVNGNVHVNANLYVDGIISGGTDTGSTFAYLTLTSTDDSINLSTGSLLTYGGITIQSPTDAMSVTNGGSFLTDGGASIGRRLFVGSGIVSASDTNTVGSLFTTNGNVGIGTTAPNVKLSLGASASTQKLAIYDELSNFYGLGAKDYVLHLHAGTTTGSPGQVVLKNNGYVGIGTTDPLQSLEIANGRLRVSQNAGSAVMEMANDTGVAYLFNNPSGNIHLFPSNTSGNLILNADEFGGVYGNLGIRTSDPSYSLDVNGTARITNDVTLTSSTTIQQTTNNYSLTSGALNISGDIVLSGNTLLFTSTGIAQPSLNGRNSGSKVVLYPQTAVTQGDYSIGVETNNTWFQVPSTLHGYKFYQGTTLAMSILDNSTVTMYSTENAIGTTGGSLVVKGGTLIDKDLKVSGSLYVDGQNLSSILGTTTIGSFSGTGVYVKTNVAIGKTMNNTNYKILGSTKTTTDNQNVYTVSFKNLTTTTFDIVIYRIDSLGSGWSDANLTVSWQITP